MDKNLNSYGMVDLIGHDILDPIQLGKALIKNHMNFKTYVYNICPLITYGEIVEIREWRSEFLRINDILPLNISREDRNKLNKVFIRKNIALVNDWRINLFREDLGIFIPIDKLNEAKCVINNFLNTKEKRNINKIARDNNIPSKRVSKISNKVFNDGNMNESKNIDAIKMRNELIIEKNMVYFNDLIQKYCLNNNISLSKNHIDFILDIFVKNDFYGIPYRSFKNSLTITDKKAYLILESDNINNLFFLIIKSSCKRFIQYENLNFYIALLKDKPRTLEVYYRFMKNEKEKNEKSFIGRDLKQILCELILLPCEICDADEEIINDVLDSINNKSKKLFIKMYNLFIYAANNLECKFMSTNIYFLDIPKEKRDVEAYPLKLYMQLAYLVFNTEYIEINKLFEKAISSVWDAQIWLYVAMHYFSMWRRGDILDLPYPILEDDIKDILKRVKEDEIDIDFYKRICNSVISQTQTMVTNKTGASLILDIPLEVIGLIGKLILICEYHRQNEGNTGLIELDTIKKVENYKGFFGDIYTDIIGNKVFSNRKANKSYANSITRIIETSVSKNQKVMGYLIVSYARSHKGSIDSIAPTTMHYLDYKSDGFSPDQFLMEIFSTGSFGFMLDTLLEWVFPYYERLSLHNQSLICKMLGLSAYKIDKKISGLTGLEKTTNRYLDECFGSIIDERDIKRKTAELLDNIANHNYTSKEKDVACCRTATGGNCVDEDYLHDTDNCRQCKFALYHRFYIQQIAKEMQECDYIIKNTKNVLERNQKTIMLKSLGNIYLSMKQELIKRYEYDVQVLDNLIMGGDLYDTGKRIK